MKQRIVINPKIMLGKPVIAGTRITVEHILRLLAQGQTMKEILANYPYLEEKDIQAVLEYAHRLVAEEEVYQFNEKTFSFKTSGR